MAVEVRVSILVRKWLYPMKYESYGYLRSSESKNRFRFTTYGPRGKFDMMVKFEETIIPDVMNLSFGIAISNESVNDIARIDNDDRNKILATVAKTIYEFSKLHPEKAIFFTGSTPARTRLYRIALTVHLGELLKDFEVFGVYLFDSSIYYEKFEKQMPYTGFAVKRKL